MAAHWLHLIAVETFGDLAFGDIFLHLLTGNLALLADEFALEDFCNSLFDGFLLTASPRSCPGHPGWSGTPRQSGKGWGSGRRWEGPAQVLPLGRLAGRRVSRGMH